MSQPLHVDPPSAAPGGPAVHRLTTPWAIVAAAHAAFGISGLSLYLSSGTGPALASDLGLANWQAGLVFAAFSAGYGLVGPFAGALATRTGATRLLSGAMLCVALTAVAFSLSTEFEQLVVLRAVLGVFAGTVTPVGTLLLARTTPPARLPLVIGVAFAGYGIGALLPFGVFVPLLGAEAWRAHARAAAALAVLVAVVLLATVSRERASAAGGESDLSLAGVRAALGLPGVQLMALYTVPILIPMLSVVSWAPAYLQYGLGATAGLAGVLTGSVGLGMLLAPLASGWLMLRVGPRRVLLLAPVAFVLLPSLMAFAATEWVVVVLVFLSGFFPKFGFSAVLAVTPRVVPLHLTGLAVGYINGLSFVVSLVPPVLFGRVLDQTGSFSLAFLALALCALPGLPLGVLIAARVHRD